MSKATLRLFAWFIVVVLCISLACNLPGHMPPPDELRPGDVQKPVSGASSQQNPSKTTQAPLNAQTPAGSSRANPAPGTELNHLEGWDIQVLQVLRGEPALKLLREQGGSNIPDIPGWDYLAAQINIRNTHVGHQMIGLYELTITGDNKVSYFDNFWGFPAPEIVYSDFFTAEAMDGWIDALVPQGEQHLMLALERTKNSDELPKEPFYMALEPGAVVDTTPPSAIQPTSLGKDPASPAPFSSTVTNGDWEVTLLETARGEKAKELMQTQHGSYMDPPAGQEVLLIRSRLRYLDLHHTGEKQAIDSHSTFKIYPNNDTGDTQSAVNETPPFPLDYTDFYPGGVYEGWSYVLVPIQTNPVVIQLNLGEYRYLVATQ